MSQPRASTSVRPADPPSPDVPVDEDEDSIMRDALARVKRVKAWKVEEARKRAEEEAAARRAAEEAERQRRAAAARRQVAQEACDRAIWGKSRRTRLSSGGEDWRRRRPPGVRGTPPLSKGKGKASAQPIGDDPDDGDDNDDDKEREPCERCKVKKIPCLEQAGKRSSVICKPCHDSKVRCSYSGRPYVVKKESKSERRTACHPRKSDGANPRRQSGLTRGELKISTVPPMALMGMGEGPATAGPSRRTAEWRRPLKRRRIVEESEEEEEGEKEREVEEKENEVEKDGEGEEKMVEEEEPAPTEAQSDKGKGRAEE
ncbi:hypothetical protein EV359DRAFT_83790 [Lentinula novae-zelandiae]|nr:hypothetical protein EV359DRAFT_83790 [Lentinula novae-zelandiae]